MKKILSYNDSLSEETKNFIIKDYVENYLSIREISKKYNIKSKNFISKLLGNYKRPISEANKIAHKKHPESFKSSEATKNKIRKARLDYMKKHPEKTAWRQSNMSYPETCFYNMLIEHGYDKKYLIYREYSVYPYYIDFAFFNEKLAVEVDGSQHLEEKRYVRDREKDRLLVENNWTVIRFTANDVMHNIQNVMCILDKYLNVKHNDNQVHLIGILKAPKTYQKAVREENGRTKLQNIASYNCRKVKDRPDKETLLNLIIHYSFLAIGRMYGVTDNAIRKWCKIYNIPHTKKEAKALSTSG